jgi:hypothetical protein
MGKRERERERREREREERRERRERAIFSKCPIERLVWPLCFVFLGDLATKNR